MNRRSYSGGRKWQIPGSVPGFANTGARIAAPFGYAQGASSDGTSQKHPMGADVNAQVPGQARGVQSGGTRPTGTGAKVPGQTRGTKVAKSDIDHSKQEPDTSRTGTEQLAEQISTDLEQLDELAQAQAQAQEINDRYLRLKAEWENYRRRTEAERADERNRATQHLLIKLLPVLDDLELALQHGADASAGAVLEGINQVLTKFTDTLKQEGLRPIDPKGLPFDVNLHNAISKQEDHSVAEDTVLEVLQKGYELGNRVLRPAMVVVSSGGPVAQSPVSESACQDTDRPTSS
ncbi:MAG: nucleotide exchange factor GrpE [Coriobacteriales bacterium]|nr:nucleotide exchange factor GrpE [Coriobacteriales bacterium]